MSRKAEPIAGVTQSSGIDLAQRLAEAEATIATLLTDQIDAVALRASEERYRRIADATREGVWMLDATLVTTCTNRRMREMLGWKSAADCVPFEFLDDEERRKLEAHLQRRDRGQIDIRYTRADGSSVLTLLEATPIETSSGADHGVLVMVIDTTDHKQAKLAVGHERDRAEAYLETAQVIMLAVDVSGSITMINRYGCSVLGWTSAELLGRSWVETCVPARVRDAVTATFKRMFISDHPMPVLIVENLVVTKSGDERLIEWRNSVMRDAADAVIGAIASGTDITDRTNAVEEVRKAEERMRFALESAEVGIWDLDYKTGALSWSPTLERQYGLAPHTFDGTFESFIKMVHPEDRESLVGAIAQAKADGSDFSVTNRAIWPDGNVRSLNGFGRIHLDAAGEPQRGVGISLDVTERRALEMRYQQSQKMDAIGQLASGVAHDFNNLLTVILGFAEFVTEDTSITERHGADLGEIIKAARRASGLTKQLLAFSRQQVLEMAPLDLNRVVSDITAMARRLIGEHIEIILELAPSLPLTVSDRGQLEQVVMNLLVNARDAMPSGGKVTITTTYAQLSKVRSARELVKDGRYLMMTVADTGTGMSKETQRRLFEPFYTTKAAGKGTGLGLSTAYGIVKQSKGYIFADSELGHGTTFTIYLPCDEGTAPMTSVTASGVRRAGQKVSETVLLVEDEAAVRELSRRGLERDGYRVFVANDGNEAERVFADRASEIDLVLTDVVMPGCGGPELLTRLRRLRPDIKFLYISGYTDQSEENEIAFRGQALLQKPFTAGDLRRRVREVLDRPPTMSHTP